MRAVHIEAWDEVFIRCRRTSANALVTHVPTWGEWWPGADVATAGDGEHTLTLATPLRLPRCHRLQITVDRVRPRDKGLEFSVSGDVVGKAEWYHLDRPQGVVVHYLLRGELQKGNTRRWLSAHRASVRSALTVLKRRLEAGRPPGAEPHPDLVAYQAQELAVFAREVAQHEQELASTRSDAILADGGV